MEMSCVEVFIFICRICSRNLTSTEIISTEIGQLSRSSWAELMEGQRCTCPSAQP